MRAVMEPDGDYCFTFAYDPDIIPKLYNLLGLDAPTNEYAPENVTSLTSAGVEMLRILNRFALDTEQKRRGKELISEINALIGTQGEAVELEPDAIRRIQAICAQTADSLRKIRKIPLALERARSTRVQVNLHVGHSIRVR